MTIAMTLEPARTLPAVEYRWDADTEILSASLVLAADGAADGAAGAPAPAADGDAADDDGGRLAGASGSVEVEGVDGSWLTLDLAAGCVRGVQVAVWPTVRRSSSLAPPEAEPARAAVALAAGRDGLVSLEVSTRLAAVADASARNFHFIFGGARGARAATAARIARDVVVELDARQRLAGLWLLNVPPCPPDP